MKNSAYFRLFPALLALGFSILAGWYYCGRSSLASRSCSAPKGGGEPNCRTDVDCQALSAEAVLLSSNVSNDCSVNANCGGGDNFRQLFYKVRLKYKSSFLTDDFDFYLDYEALSAKVQLVVSGTAPLYSSIDATTTLSCYKNGPGATWGDTTGGNSNVAIFSVEPYGAAIHFLDESTEDCAGDKIHFTAGSCTGQYYCAYADLFTVAVNAYAGETVQLRIIDAVYEPGTGGGCDLSRNYDAAVTVAIPAAPAAAPNNNISVHLKDPEASGDGGCEIDIEVVNSGSSEVFIAYLEFVAKVSPGVNTPPFWVDSDDNDPPIKIGNDYYVRFSKADGVSVAANGTAYLGRITLGPGVVTGAAWSSSVALVDDTKSRLKTSLSAAPDTYYCSRLHLDTGAETCSGGGSCQLPVTFKVWPPENVSSNCPSEKKVKVGIVSATWSSIDVQRLAFNLKFALSGGAAITGVNDHPGTNDLCDNPDVASCYHYFNSNQSDCWSLPGDDLFQFCFEPASPVSFDLSGDEGAYLEILFNDEGCINGVTIEKVELFVPSPYVDCTPVLGALPDPFILCEPQVFGKLATEAENGLSDADVTLKAVQNSCSGSCSDQTEASSDSPDAGNYSFCPCLNCTAFDVVPYKNNDPLNGVSTFDLVLINKAILGLEPLNSPYKMIAADANKSRSLTPLDLIELRKLILGLYTTLPNNTSWRFVDKDYSFPFPDNAFYEIFPETKTVDLSSNPIQEANFVAVKVGDVNGNVVTTSFLPRPVTTLVIPAVEAAKTGQVITVPVRYSGAGPLEAFQLGLRFDLAALSLIGPSQGDLPGYNAGNFGLTGAAQGEIRSLWFADPSVPGEALYPGDVLFYLSFRVKAPRSEAAGPLLQVDAAVLLSAAWNAGGAEYALRCGAEPDQRVASGAEAPVALQASCHPNPASGETQLTVRADRAGRARIGLYDAFGKRECGREVTLMAGEQTFALPQSAQLPAGVYFWKVLTPWAKAQGHWIKQ